MSEEKWFSFGGLFGLAVDYPERVIIVREKISQKRKFVQAVNVFRKNIKYDDWVAGECNRQIDRGLEVFDHIDPRRSAMKFVRDNNPGLNIKVAQTIEKSGAKYHVLEVS